MVSCGKHTSNAQKVHQYLGTKCGQCLKEERLADRMARSPSGRENHRGSLWEEASLLKPEAGGREVYSSLSFTNISPTPRKSGAAFTATVGENVLSKDTSLASWRRAFLFLSVPRNGAGIWRGVRNGD